MENQKTAEQESSSRSRSPIGTTMLTGIVSFIIGSIFGIVGTYILIVQRVTKLEDQLASVSAHTSMATSSADGSAVSISANPAANQKTADAAIVLPELIGNLQRTFVRESWGEGAHENFTAEDRRKFLASNQLQAIVERLKRNNEFIDVVLAIKRLPPSERQRLLESCRKPLHQTWGQMGRISRDGQTESGQDTELMIANAVVDAVQSLSLRSDAEIRKLYS